MTAGKDDSVRIDIPKGGYLPAFGRHGLRGRAAAAPAETSDPHSRRLPLWRHAIGLILVLLLGVGIDAWVLVDRAATPVAEPRQARGAERGPALAVVPFEILSEGSAGKVLANGLTEQLISNLLLFPISGCSRARPASPSRSRAIPPKFGVACRSITWFKAACAATPRACGSPRG